MASTVSDKGHSFNLRRSICFAVGLFFIALVAIAFVAPQYHGCEPLGSVASLEAVQNSTTKDTSVVQQEGVSEIPLATTLDAGVSQTPIGEGDEGDDMLSAVILPSDAVLVSTQQNEWGRGWTYLWVGIAATAAQEVLHGFDDGRWELIHASTLDLYGEAWGCVVREKGRARTIMVHIAPTSISAYSTEPSELLISVSEMGAER